MKKKRIISISIVVVILILIISQIGFLISLGESLSLNSKEMTELTVEENVLYMNNLINSKTPKQIKDVFEKYPSIDTIVMLDVPGSVDDDANLEIATWISKKNLTIKLLSTSHIASGGTDFFLAGKIRIIENGAKIGVHSWGIGTDSATDYPKGHEYHQPYIKYYQEIGWNQKQAEDFYYFTIYSAPAENIHYMTNDELIKYGISTQEIIQ